MHPFWSVRRPVPFRAASCRTAQPGGLCYPKPTESLRLLYLVAGSVFVILVPTLLVLGLTSGTVAGFGAGLSPLSLILPAGILARRLNWSWPCALYMPFMFPVFFYALLNLTFVTLRPGGIRWRDTFYPLETLRAGNVR